MGQTPNFSLTPKQAQANDLLASSARHILLRGGSRSGKTFLLCRAVAIRALKAPGSTHAVLRYRFSDLKDSVIRDTFPKVFSLCLPGVPNHLNKTDWFLELPNGARILFGGLDDKERTEKILGQEHSTIYLNECSQISYSARNTAMTRLAQNSGLVLKAYYDANPPTVGHWTYRLFEKRVEPTSGAPLTSPDAYASMMMNPVDNTANLPAEYISILEALPQKERLRFLEGQYLSQVDGALWSMDSLDKCRDAPISDDAKREAIIGRLQRIVVAVDPSGCRGPEDERSDEIGIVVVGLGFDGVGRVLEDVSGRYSPEGWANVALTAFDRWRADTIVGEINYGGALVESNLRIARRTVPFKTVHASRGKHVRAEPVAALYTQGKVKHAGAFPDLEDQLCNFSAAGYQGARSPDRADAAVWGLTELMLGESKPSAAARSRAMCV